MQNLKASSSAYAGRRVRDPSDGSVQQDPSADATFNAGAATNPGASAMANAMHAARMP